MRSASTDDNHPETNALGAMKRLATRIDAIIVIGLFILVGVFAVNGITRHSRPPDSPYMSTKEIQQMLLKDTERMNLFVKSIQKVPKEIATILGLQKLRKEEIKIVLSSILLNSPELYGSAVAYEPYAFDRKSYYASSYVYRKDGAVQYITLDDPEYDYFHKDWYLLPKILQKPVWVEPYFDEGGGGIFMTTYAVPFSFFNGVKATFTGVATVDVSIKWLTRYFMANKKLPHKGFVMLLSGDGTILSAPNKDWVVNQTIFSLAVSLQIPELRKVGRDLQEGKSGVASLTSRLNQKAMKIFYAVVPANKWGILYIIPDEGGDTKSGDFTHFSL
jgi:phosphoserine phosphatase RsbU/P